MASAVFHGATLWTGGFPCQDLSVAGKRRGMGTEDDRTRSGLAYAFLDLVERHRPPAILLENVPGLLSSNGGKDLGALLGRLGQLGYWWAYRVLDAQHFGVPQRRRRVFIVALHAGAGFGADSAAAVLSVGTRCRWHPATGHETGEGVAGGVEVGTLNAGMDSGVHNGQDDHAGFLISSSPDSGGVREADGLAGRLDDGDVVAFDPTAGRDMRAYSDGTTPGMKVGTTIATMPWAPAISRSGRPSGDDPMLPLGLDSHRYRCCGNGVVSDVSEWIGVRLLAALV